MSGRGSKYDGGVRNPVRKKPKLSTVLISKLIHTNYVLSGVIQDLEIDIDVLVEKDKYKKKKRITPTKSFQAIRKDLH
mgnify:CR=1 FL=1